MSRTSFFFSPVFFWICSLLFLVFVFLLFKNIGDLNGGDEHLIPLEAEVSSLQQKVETLENEEKNRMSQYYKEKSIRDELNMKLANEEVLQIKTYNIIPTPTPTLPPVSPTYQQWLQLLF